MNLRGLPFCAGEQDVKDFLGEHTSQLKDSDSVHIICRRNGRSAGYAHVQFMSKEAAQAFRLEKNMEYMTALDHSQAPPR
eukprot:1640874-Karenia_brevis.AAC.1